MQGTIKVWIPEAWAKQYAKDGTPPEIFYTHKPDSWNSTALCELNIPLEIYNSWLKSGKSEKQILHD